MARASVQQRAFTFAKRRSILSATALTAAGIAMTISPAMAQNWTDHQVIIGDTTVDTSIPNTTNITQHTHFTKVQGNGDIDAGWTVNVAQPSTSSKYILYDTKDDPTVILGNLNANGEIYIFDQNGVIFGKDSRVDVGSLIATTGRISDADILDNDGRLTIEDAGEGFIDIQGSISVADAGLAAFVSPSVKNSGVINAKLGKVALASGEKVTLDLYGDKLVEIALNDQMSDAIIENSGVINAEGGTVVLQAGAAKDIVNNTVNMSGVINASSATVKGGKIVLGGGTVKVSGKLDASGKNGGGKIDVKGTNVQVADTAVLQSDAYFTGNGGDIDIIAEDHADFRGAILSRGGENGGNGGNAEVSGYKVLGYQGYADLSAAEGVTGTLLLDPEFAVIHSGVLHNPLGLGVIISAQALANSMRTSNVVLQADDFIDVGTKQGGYNISTGNAILDGIVNAGLNALPDGDIDLSSYNIWNLEVTGYIWGFIPVYGLVNYTGTTTGGLKLDTDTVNFNRDLTLGNGSVTVDANTVNLDSKIFESNGSTLLGDSRISSNAGTVNVLSNDASIQQGVYLANDAGGATVNLADTTFTQGNIDINKSMTISGAGRNDTTLDATGFANGFQITQDLGNKNVTIRRMTIENANQDGVLVADTANLKTISLNQVALRNNAYHGFALYGDSAQAFNILNSVFLDNGFGGSSKGEGDIMAFLYNGDATIRNVDIQNNSAAGLADYGIQLRGSDTFASSGEIVLDNVSVAGSYRAAPLGIQRFTDVDLTMTDVELGGVTNLGTQTTGFGSLYVSNIGTNPLDIGNTSFGSTTSQYIENDSAADIDATSASFEGVTGATATLDENFAIEDKIKHKIDIATRGLVTWVENTVFVTQNSGSIQRGIDAADVGASVYVGDGVFSEQLVINKNLDLIGAGAFNTTVLNAPAVMTQSYSQDGRNNYAVIYVHDAADVDISGFQIDGSTNSGNVYNDNNRFIGVAYQNAGGDFTDNWVRNIATTGNSSRSGFAFLGSAKNTASTINLSGNTFDGFQKYGIALADSRLTANLTDNIILGHKDTSVAEQTGVYVTSGAKVTADLNEISEVDYGVEISNSVNGFYEENTLKNVHNGFKIVNSRNTDLLNNDIDGNSITGVSIVNSDNSSVTGGTIDTFTNGVVVNNSDNVTIDGVTFKNISDTSVSVTDSDNATVQKNTIKGGMTGIKFVNVTNSTIGGVDDSFANKIRNIVSGWNNSGINISGGSNLNVSYNDLKDIGGQGIYAQGFWAMPETVLTISNNTIKDTEHTGIFVKQWNGADIVDNKINGTTYGHGIDLELTDNTDVTGNVIRNVAGSGVHLFYGNEDTLIEDNTINGALVGVKLSNAGGQINRRVDILSNDISNTVETGISLQRGEGVTITGNELRDLGQQGVAGQYLKDIIITDNLIRDMGHNGVFIEDARNLDISGNRIFNSAQRNGLQLVRITNLNVEDNVIDGVRFDGMNINIAKNVTILNNIVRNAQDDGIYLRNTYDGPVVTGNTVRNSGADGVELSYVEGATVADNTITGSGEHGIKAELTKDSDITDNIIRNSTGNGIYLYHGNDRILLEENTIDNALNGIDIFYEGTSVNNDIEVVDNTISNMVHSGIKMRRSNGITMTGNTLTDLGLQGIHGQYLKDITITDNLIRDMGHNGVFIEDASNVDISGNRIFDSAQRNGLQLVRINNLNVEDNVIDGIRFDGMNINIAKNVTILNNIVRNTQDDGIYLRNMYDGLTVEGNTVRNAGTDGIELSRVEGATVTRNRVLDAGDAGIKAIEGADLTISRNVIRNAGEEGIYAEGIDGLDVLRNRIRNAQGDGMNLSSVSDLLVRRNIVTGSGDDGIAVGNATDARIVRNRVEGSTNSGIHVYGGSNGDVALSGNILTDNDIGAKFESGIIDLTGETNVITGGLVGLQFDPGAVTTSPVTLLALPSVLSLLNDTIGTTEFTGQSEFYVELLNGALFDPGTPTVIDGTQARFDGVSASDDPSFILSVADYNAINDKLWHYPNDNTLGLFFFGNLPTTFSISQEDQMQYFGLVNLQITGLNLTINGLPRIEGGPQNLNNIAPFAGNDPASLNAIGTAAGDEEPTPEELSRVQTQAGGTEASCWGDAAALAQSGQIVNVNYGSSPEDILNGAANCGSSL